MIGYLPAVFIAGLFARHDKTVLDVFAMILASVVVYAMGVTWLKIVTGMAYPKAVAVGMLPFLIGDAVKIAAAAAIAKAVRPVLRGM